jgi:hypothetical protein
MEKLEWSALEYEEKNRSQDWFWALGIIVVTSSIASIIFGDYFFAALLILSGILLGFFAVKKPEMIYYELNNLGLQIKDRIYPYENMKYFWVQVGNSPADLVLPLLFIHSDRIFLPIISVPIEATMAEKIHSVMLEKDVAEKKMKEHPSEKIMEFLGF